MSHKRAIVIPTNPHLEFYGGTAIGSLIAHKMFADKQGAVYWDLEKGSCSTDINTAYFYETEEGAATYKAKVDFIDKKDNIKPNEEKYIPNWRKINWQMKQSPGQVWVKLRDIFPLKRKHPLADFRKAIDGDVLRRVQNFAIVDDPAFVAIPSRFSLNEFVDDYIYRLASQKDEKLLEADIEEMVWFMMLDKNLEYVDRQRGKDDRIDVAFKNKENDFIIVEIKRGIAGLSALKQIRRYMKIIGRKHKARQLAGVILCRKADFELQTKVKRLKAQGKDNISIDEYKFSIDFRLIKDMLAQG